MKHLLVLLVVLALSAGAATTGASAAGSASTGTAQSQSSACFFPKTKFLFHSGLAFGAFHRYILKPYKAGAFTGVDKVKAIAKAAVAAAFVYHEINESLKQAQCSHALSVLVSPLTAVLGALKTATDQLKAGGLPDIGSLGTAFDQIGQSAGGAGAPIKDLLHVL